ncbi:MAG TPA: hypothetical protein VK629_20095 [Steroidobacteraceae bacterium]|nr:hypothetical protein [Steroidobacteraceae bacterium]
MLETSKLDGKGRRLKIETAIADAKVSLFQTAAPTLLPLPELEELDLRLLLAWSNKPLSSTPVTMAAIRASLSLADIARLYSARSAEHIVMDYCLRRQIATVDVSIMQLQRNCVDWKSHDICAGSMVVDVKNARRSSSCPLTYSEYWVPEFKEVRELRLDVTIAAVSSPYKNADRVDVVNGQFGTFLGFVRKADLDNLGSWLQATFGNDLMVAGLSEGKRLPGWCFEYDAGHYPTREGTRRLVNEAADLWLKSSDLWNGFRFPKVLLPFIDCERTINELANRPGTSEEQLREHHSTYREIVSLRDSIGLSRRSLFALVLAYTLRRSRQPTGRWTPKYFEDWLFFDQCLSNRRSPLGLEDPCEYVYRLVLAMKVLWSHRKKLCEYMGFRLVSAWILRGIMADGSEDTIMAHCGGWRELRDGTTVKCGFSPLVLGNDRLCPRCRRLACHVCGFCSKRCAGPHGIESKPTENDDMISC